MIEQEIIVGIQHGLHARPAANLVQIANRFQSSIELDDGKKKVNVKSILNLISLGVREGQTIKLVISGEDEEEALVKMETFITSV